MESKEGLWFDIGSGSCLEPEEKQFSEGGHDDSDDILCKGVNQTMSDISQVSTLHRQSFVKVIL